MRFATDFHQIRSGPGERDKNSPSAISSREEPGTSQGRGTSESRISLTGARKINAFPPGFLGGTPSLRRFDHPGRKAREKKGAKKGRGGRADFV